MVKLLTTTPTTWAVQTGSSVSKMDYAPFGEDFRPASERYKFTGKEDDVYTGLYYFNARYYDPAIGRFITEDPAKDGGNWYVYCRNNPLRHVDPSGNALESGWDYFSLATGVASFTMSIKKGDLLGAIIDGVGIVADGAALILPGVPGGAGAAIKGLRIASGAADIIGGGREIIQGIENEDGLQVGIGVLQTVGGVGQLSSVFKVTRVNIDDLLPNPKDPFDYDAGNYNLEALRNARRSIQETGTISKPITVKRLKDGTYQIVDGHHRWYAAKQMGLKELPIEFIE